MARARGPTNRGVAVWCVPKFLVRLKSVAGPFSVIFNSLQGHIRGPVFVVHEFSDSVLAPHKEIKKTDIQIA